MVFKLQEKGGELNPGQIRFNELAYLVTKVVNEIKHPRQFLNPTRAIGLVGNGIYYLSHVVQGIELERDKIEMNINSSLLLKKHENGLVIAYSNNIPIQFVAFPVSTRLSFYCANEKIKPEDAANEKFRFIATTTTDAQGFPHIPNQGFMTSEGIQIPFIDTDPTLRSQCGAFHINNGSIKLLDYDGLQRIKQTNLIGPEIVMGVNWYMDSLNQGLVPDTKEHQIRKPYNCLGIAQAENGEIQFFHMASANPKGIAENVFNHKVISQRDVFLKEMAAMVNVMAKKMKWQSWRLGGLEYCGGSLLYSCNKYNEFPRFIVSYN